MCKHIRVVTRQRVQVNDSLHIVWHFFLAIHFIYHEHRPLLIINKHHVRQVFHSHNYSATSITATLADHKPVAKVSHLPDIRLNLLQNHRKTKEQRSSHQLLCKQLASELLNVELCSKQVSFCLNIFCVSIGNFTKKMAQTVRDRLKLPSVVLGI